MLRRQIISCTGLHAHAHRLRRIAQPVLSFRLISGHGAADVAVGQRASKAQAAAPYVLRLLTTPLLQSLISRFYILASAPSKVAARNAQLARHGFSRPILSLAARYGHAADATHEQQGHTSASQYAEFLSAHAMAADGSLMRSAERYFLRCRCHDAEPVTLTYCCLR